MITSVIKKRWENAAAELMRSGRLDRKIYEDVVSALAQMEMSPETPETERPPEPSINLIRR
jgi:hypothetical protein